MDYIVLFDVASKPWPWGTFLLLVAFAAACFVIGRWPPRRYSERDRWTNLVLSRMGLVLAIIALVGSTWSYETHRHRMMTALAHGAVSVVEGAISSVTRPRPTHNGPECFTVESRSFCYRSNQVTPAFNHTAGPIRQGLWVRVTYQDKEILRLETTKSAFDRANGNASADANAHRK